MSAASTKICAIYCTHAFVQMVQQLTVIKSKHHHGTRYCILKSTMFESKTSAALGAQAQLHHDVFWGHWLSSARC